MSGKFKPYHTEHTDKRVPVKARVCIYLNKESLEIMEDNKVENVSGFINKCIKSVYTIK